MHRCPLRFLLTLTCCLILPCASRAAQSAPALPDRAHFHLFLLIGQSNMAGRGTVTPDDTNAPARVLMLSQAGSWVPARDPMHFDKPIAGVGLGRSFGMHLAHENPGITIGLIPAAVGGSPIDSWRPGQFYAPTQSYPWDDAMARARLAMKDGTLKGILWHQGESDATPELAPAYAAKLADLVHRLRRDLRSPEVPFIVGQLGRFKDAPWTDSTRTVDRAQQDLKRHVRRVAFVPANGLEHNGDKLHFNAAAYREFGHRYATVYCKLAQRPRRLPRTRGGE